MLLLFLLVYIVYLQHFNNIYRNQVKQSNDLIDKLMYRDSIFSEIVDVVKTDTSIGIIRLLDTETKRTIKYSELDSMCSFYFKQNEIKDAIILQAKRKYKFNYSYKLQGDTMIIYFWNKSE